MVNQQTERIPAVAFPSERVRSRFPALHQKPAFIVFDNADAIRGRPDQRVTPQPDCLRLERYLGNVGACAAVVVKFRRSGKQLCSSSCINPRGICMKSDRFVSALTQE